MWVFINILLDAVKWSKYLQHCRLIMFVPGSFMLTIWSSFHPDYLRKIIVQGRSSKSTKVGDIMTEEVYIIGLFVFSSTYLEK